MGQSVCLLTWPYQEEIMTSDTDPKCAWIRTVRENHVLWFSQWSKIGRNSNTYTELVLFVARPPLRQVCKRVWRRGSVALTHYPLFCCVADPPPLRQLFHSGGGATGTRHRCHDRHSVGFLAASTNSSSGVTYRHHPRCAFGNQTMKALPGRARIELTGNATCHEEERNLPRLLL